MTPAQDGARRSGLGYRPALDGLRGVAVLMVFGGHARIPGFGGAGQIGVIIFFVLSGFLITTLLLRERRSDGRIDLGNFYRKRALRLLPALVVTLGLVSVLMFSMGRAHEVPVDVLSTLFYARNWFTAMGENPGLLSHAWSLSIEEQFYIIWPIALIGILRIFGGSLRVTAMCLITGIVAITVWRALLWAPELYDRVFWATDTRADALLIGCLLAILVGERSPIVRWPLLVVAVGGLAAARLLYDGDLFAVLGMSVAALSAGIVVVAALQPIRWLTWAPLVMLGTMSYGFYLLHRPVTRIAVDMGYGREPLAITFMFGASLGLAYVSYRYVEKPFLRMKTRRGTAAGPVATQALTTRPTQ